MEFSEVVRRRRMVRRFDPDRPVPPTALDTLLDAARRAPSAGFTQGVSFLVLDEPADRDDFWRLAAEPGPPDRWLRGLRAAPVLVLVWTSEASYRERYAEPDKAAARARHDSGPGADPDGLPWSVPFWYVDAGMAVQALLYAAVDAGLGAAFVAVPEPRLPLVRERFGVPPAEQVVGVVALGHPAAEGLADEAAGPGRRRGSPGRRPRKPLAAVVHRGHWSDHDPPPRNSCD